MISVIFVASLFLASCRDNAASEKVQKLEEENKTLISQIEAEQKQRQALEQTVFELRRRIQQMEDSARQANDRLSAGQWNELVDQVLIKLERVKNEHRAFSSARRVPEFTSEETRLKSLALEQESQVRSSVNERNARKFPNAGQLDQLIKAFTSAYTSYIGCDRVSWQLEKTFGKVPDNIKKNESKYLDDYNQTLDRIRALKEKE